jgi:polyphosphate kinase
MMAFCREGELSIWAGSGDWMERNFDRRLEVFFPIPEPERRRLWRLLNYQLSDDVNAFVLEPSGGFRPLWGGCRNSQLKLL